MPQTGMHELKREKLPDIAVFQSFHAQSKIAILNEQTVRITRNRQFEEIDKRVDNDERHGQRKAPPVIRLAHVITIFKHN